MLHRMLEVVEAKLCLLELLKSLKVQVIRWLEVVEDRLYLLELLDTLELMFSLLLGIRTGGCEG